MTEFVNAAIKRGIAVVALASIYNASALCSRLFRKLISPGRGGRSGVLLIGTFHNPNWMNAHLLPLVDATAGKVVLVCDEPIVHLDGIQYLCPPKWLSAVLTRAMTKFLWALAASFRHKPILVMGYHIFPAAVSALVVARVSGAYAGYQVTAGQLELEGGGWNSENRLLAMLGKPSVAVDTAVLRCVRQFDSTVVRGTRAKEFLRRNGHDRAIEIITGSVEAPKSTSDYNRREFDMIFVGRLTEYKRPDRMLRVVAMARKQGSDLSVHVVGDGPDKADLMAMAEDLGIDDLVVWAGQRRDVPELLKNAKIYVLTSRWEGVSIALLEGMSAGCVPVVSDVGDLSDVVEDGHNGWVVAEDDIARFVDRIQAVMGNADDWRAKSARAMEAIAGGHTRDVIARRWKTEIARLGAGSA